MIKIEFGTVMFIICVIIVYLLATFDIVLRKDFNLSFLNPVNIYKEWCYTLNWFGMSIIIAFLNIVFLPYAIIYWVIKLIYFTVTVGRKEK